MITWGQEDVATALACWSAEAISVPVQPCGSAADWETLFYGVGWFHLSGLTPAASEAAAAATLAAVQAACEAEATISLDLRFDPDGWQWQPGTDPRDLAEATLRRLLPLVDVVITNETDAVWLLRLTARDDQAPIRVEESCDAAVRLAEQYSNLQYAVITLREPGAESDRWGAMIYDVDGLLSHMAPVNARWEYVPYAVATAAGQRVNDAAFAAGLSYALSTFGLDDPAVAIQYAVAASSLPLGACREDVEAQMRVTL